jgi:hypothetical protein
MEGHENFAFHLVAKLSVELHVMFILIGPHVRYFSDGNQTVCPTLKNKSWPLIMQKQRERCLLLKFFINNCQNVVMLV